MLPFAKKTKPNESTTTETKDETEASWHKPF